MASLRERVLPPEVEAMLNTLNTAIVAALERPAEDEVHRLRVALKRVRSLMRLARRTTGGRHRKTRERLDVLFLRAGRVRDRHVLIALLARERSGGIAVIKARRHLGAHADRDQVRLHRHLERSADLVAEVRATIARELGPLSPSSWRGVVRRMVRADLLDATDHLHHDPAPEALHTVRKRLKHVLHAIDLWPQRPLPQELVRIRRLGKRAQALLGNRQDLVLLLGLFRCAASRDRGEDGPIERVKARLHRADRKVRTDLQALLPERRDHLVASTSSSSALRPKRKTSAAGQRAPARSADTVKPAARRRSK